MEHNNTKNSINLKKHNTVNLTKASPALVKVGLGLGWTSPAGKKVDLDLSVFPVNALDFCDAADMLFYGVQKDPVTCLRYVMDKALSHGGDDQTGGNSLSGDDETVIIDLSKIRSSISRLVVVATVHEDVDTGMKFSEAIDAYIRVYNADTNEEIAKYIFEKENTDANALEFISLSKDDDKNWHVNAIGMGHNGGLAALCNKFKIGVE